MPQSPGLLVNPSWSWSAGSEYTYIGSRREGIDFPADPIINSKIFITELECWKFEVDAIVVGTNERMTDRSSLNEVRTSSFELTQMLR